MAATLEVELESASPNCVPEMQAKGSCVRLVACLFSSFLWQEVTLSHGHMTKLRVWGRKQLTQHDTQLLSGRDKICPSSARLQRLPSFMGNVSIEKVPDYDDGLCLLCIFTLSTFTQYLFLTATPN